MKFSAYTLSLCILIPISAHAMDSKKANPSASPTAQELRELRMQTHHNPGSDDPIASGYRPLLDPADDLNAANTRARPGNLRQGTSQDAALLQSYLVIFRLFQSCCPLFGPPEPGE